MALIRHDIIKGTSCIFYAGKDTMEILNVDYENTWMADKLNNDQGGDQLDVTQQIIESLKKRTKPVILDEDAIDLQKTMKQMIDSEGFKRLPKKERSELLRLYNEKLFP